MRYHFSRWERVLPSRLLSAYWRQHVLCASSYYSAKSPQTAEMAGCFEGRNAGKPATLAILSSLPSAVVLKAKQGRLACGHILAHRSILLLDGKDSPEKVGLPSLRPVWSSSGSEETDRHRAWFPPSQPMLGTQKRRHSPGPAEQAGQREQRKVILNGKGSGQSRKIAETVADSSKNIFLRREQFFEKSLDFWESSRKRRVQKRADHPPLGIRGTTQSEFLQVRGKNPAGKKRSVSGAWYV